MCKKLTSYCIKLFNSFFLNWNSLYAGQPLQGMQLQGKEAQKDQSIYTGNLFRNNLQLIGVC